MAVEIALFRGKQNRLGQDHLEHPAGQGRADQGRDASGAGDGGDGEGMPDGMRADRRRRLRRRVAADRLARRGLVERMGSSDGSARGRGPVTGPLAGVVARTRRRLGHCGGRLPTDSPHRSRRSTPFADVVSVRQAFPFANPLDLLLAAPRPRSLPIQAGCSGRLANSDRISASSSGETNWIARSAAVRAPQRSAAT